MSLPRSSQSPGEPRNKRLRRLSSTEEEMDLGTGRDKGAGEVAYYGQSPASLSSQTSWHSDVDHGGLGTSNFSSSYFLLQFYLIHSLQAEDFYLQVSVYPCSSFSVPLIFELTILMVYNIEKQIFLS